MRDVPTQWRAPLGSVNARSGRQKCDDAIFYAAWGSQWRDCCDTFADKRQWMASRCEFVRKVCDAMGLPQLWECEPAHSATTEAVAPLQKPPKGWNMTDLALPAFLARDGLWTRGVARTQLEFVVDNQKLANIANGLAAVANQFYQAPLDRIRAGLRQLFHAQFEYKATFLDPVDWRPREFNTAADHVANCVLAGQADVNALQDEDVCRCAQTATAIQVFSDGGYVHGLGAAAIVIVAVREEGGQFHHEIVGARGVLVKPARSAFQMEVMALDMAIAVLLRA